MTHTDARIELLILQPTSFCNIECDYCYLPGRNNPARMNEQVLDSLLAATLLSRLGPVDKPDPALDAGEQDEANEAAGCLVISCGDPALFFEVADAALDA